MFLQKISRMILSKTSARRLIAFVITVVTVLSLLFSHKETLPPDIRPPIQVRLFLIILFKCSISIFSHLLFQGTRLLPKHIFTSYQKTQVKVVCDMMKYNLIIGMTTRPTKQFYPPNPYDDPMTLNAMQYTITCFLLNLRYRYSYTYTH